MENTSTDPLLLDLRSPSPEAQASAARRLGRRGDASAQAAVLELAASPHPSVRAAGLWAADQMNNGAALPAFLSALHDPAFEVRSAAGWGLVHLGAVAVEPVRRVASFSVNRDAVEMARLVLANIPPVEHIDAPSRAPAGEVPESLIAARVQASVHDLRGALTVARASVECLQESCDAHGPLADLLTEVARAEASLAGHAHAVMRWAQAGGLRAASPVYARYGHRAVVEPGLILFRELAADVNALQTGAAAVSTLDDATYLEYADAVEGLRAAARSVGLLLREASLTATHAGDASGRAPEVVDPEAFAARLGTVLRVLCKPRGLHASVRCAPEARRVARGDGRGLERAVDNLVTNAVKYTPAGSVAVELSAADGALLVRVADTGRGIPAELLERLFEPGASRRRDRAPSSYGVGLSFVARAVAEVGGRITVESALDVGSTFKLEWPVAWVEDSPTPTA